VNANVVRNEREALVVAQLADGRFVPKLVTIPSKSLYAGLSIAVFEYLAGACHILAPRHAIAEVLFSMVSRHVHADQESHSCACKYRN